MKMGLGVRCGCFVECGDCVRRVVPDGLLLYLNGCLCLLALRHAALDALCNNDKDMLVVCFIVLLSCIVICVCVLLCSCCYEVWGVLLFLVWVCVGVVGVGFGLSGL